MTQSKLSTSLLLLLVMLITSCQIASEPRERWTEEQANDWYEQWGWLRGSNFTPSNAINQLEMWQAETFDPETIDRELGWAADIGMNCMRVYLHHAAWAADPEGFKTRVEQYMDIAESHGVSTIFVFFDDCWNPTFNIGTQPDPKPGVHNSGWVRDPGDLLYEDPALIEKLERYVKDILTTFKEDERIVFWDLYNEPGNSGYGNKSLPLVKKAFEWARTVNPIQPLSVGVWTASLPELNAYSLNESDVISYHNYNSAEIHQQAVDSLKGFNRPLICTEYMARTSHSTFQDIMPLLKEDNIGAINWGLVAGKTNTIFAWDTPLPDSTEPPLWFHDIFRQDGSPYSAQEIEFIRKITQE
ncbi:MAG: cellulase family glycosylhydrolase [Sphingobacterium sp.]